MARISLRIDEKDVFFAKAQLAEKRKNILIRLKRILKILIYY
jgi:hypothetical protein